MKVNKKLFLSIFFLSILTGCSKEEEKYVTINEYYLTLTANCDGQEEVRDTFQVPERTYKTVTANHVAGSCDSYIEVADLNANIHRGYYAGSEIKKGLAEPF